MILFYKVKSIISASVHFYSHSVLEIVTSHNIVDYLKFAKSIQGKIQENFMKFMDEYFLQE